MIAELSLFDSGAANNRSCSDRNDDNPEDQEQPGDSPHQLLVFYIIPHHLAQAVHPMGKGERQQQKVIHSPAEAGPS